MTNRSPETALIATPDDLARHIKRTRAGQKLVGKSRFDYFRGDLSHELWEKTLGADVNNFRHMGFTASLVDKLMRNEANHPNGVRLPPDAELALTVTAQTHDLGEATTGDLPAGLKSSSDELPERVALAMELDAIKKHCTTLMEEMLSLVPDIAFGCDTADRRSTYLAKIFSAIESIGYTTTALKAWSIHQRLDSPRRYSLPMFIHNGLSKIEQASLSMRLGQLAVEVIGSKYFSRLIEYSSFLPSLTATLSSQRGVVNQIYESCPSFDWYVQDGRLDARPDLSNLDEPTRRQDLFNLARTEWSRFDRNTSL